MSENSGAGGTRPLLISNKELYREEHWLLATFHLGLEGLKQTLGMICMDFNKRFVDKWLCSRWYMRDFFADHDRVFFAGRGPSSRSTTLLLGSSALVAAIGNHFFMKWVKGQERSRQTNEHVSMSVKEPLINYSPNSHIIRDAVHSKVCLSMQHSQCV